MPLTIVSSERFAEHQTPPGHPESPARAGIFHDVAEDWRAAGGRILVPVPATDLQLLRVHSEAHLQRLEAVKGRSASLDSDTFTSPETLEIARLAAGAAVNGVDAVLRGDATSALALVRPPGHHAERDRAMGFCFYNNVAVAAAHARAQGLERIAIVDYDVHHGNGTQHIFESDPHVLYVSMHQYPYYPGTGGAEEVGLGPGRGRTVNIPLEVGATDDDYRVAFEEIVGPVVAQFDPELMLVSAGFDAHERDPLGGMRLTTAAFGAMTLVLRSLADECCEGRIVGITEGGYDLEALRDGLTAVTSALGAAVTRPPEWPVAGRPSSRGAAATALTKRAHAGFWKLTG